MPPPLGFTLPPPKGHAPAPSLNLARSKSTGPPSVAGSATSATSDESRRRVRTPTSATFSLRRSSNTTNPLSLPRSTLELIRDEQAPISSTDSLPLPEGEPEPVDAGAWAASINSYPPPSHDERRPSRPRVQFAPDTTVALFDADTEVGSSADLEEVADGFQAPHGREMAAVVISISGLTLLSVAAVLTTVYDWVL